VKSERRNWEDECGAIVVVKDRYIEESVRYESLAWGRGGPTAMGRKAIDLCSMMVRGPRWRIPFFKAV
jgi:hypothetical protein